MNSPTHSAAPSAEPRRELVGQIFLDVCLLGDDERSTVVAQRCDNDPELLREVESLLAFAKQADPIRFFSGVGADFLSATSNTPTIPGYRLLSVLGTGGMATVYLARRSDRSELVALKVLHRGFLLDPKLQERFHREASVMARLAHPGIVQVYDDPERDDGTALCMELCTGGTLADRLLGKKPMPPRQAAELLLELSQAIAYAHAHGICHRDLKPSNILFDAQHRAKLADFGNAIHTDDERLTRSVAWLTPRYAAPEQHLFPLNPPNPLSDVYALGTILYECLAGQPPFVGDLHRSVRDRVLHDEPIPLRRLQRQTPRDLQTICLKCLEKQPGNRYLSAQALAEDLTRYLRGEPIHARPLTRWQRLRRWVQGNPWAASLILVLMLSVGGMAVLLRSAIAAEAARTEALQKAQQHAAAVTASQSKLEAAASSVRDIALTLSDLAPPPTNAHPMPDRDQVMAKQEKVAASCRSLLRTVPNDVRLRILLARMTHSLGIITYTQDRFVEATDYLEEARTLWRGLRDEDVSNLEYHGQLVSVLGTLFHAAHRRQLPTTLDVGRELLAAQEDLTARSPHAEAQHDAVWVRSMLVKALLAAQRPDEARSLLERNRVVLEKLPVSGEPNRQAVFGQTWQALGEMHAAANQHEEFRRCLKRAYEEYQKLPESEVKYNLVAAVALLLGRETGPDQRRYALEALTAAEQVVALVQPDMEREPDNASVLLRLVEARDNVAKAHEILGKIPAAIQAHREAAETYRRLGNPRPNVEDSGPVERQRFSDFVGRLSYVADLQETAGLADDCRATRERMGNVIRLRLEVLLARGEQDEESIAAMASLGYSARLARQPELSLRAAEASRDCSLRLLALAPERLGYHRCLAEAHTQVCKSYLQLNRHRDGVKEAQSALSEAQFLHGKEPSRDHARLVETCTVRLHKLLREVEQLQEVRPRAERE